MRVENFRSLEQELCHDSHFLSTVEDIVNEMQEEDDDQSTPSETPGPAIPHGIHWYLGIRALRRFESLKNRLPDLSSDSAFEQDVADVEVIARELASEWKLSPDLFTRAVYQEL